MRISLRTAVITTLLCAFGSAAPGAADDGGQRIEAKSPSGKGSYTFTSELAIGGPQGGAETQFYEKSGTVEVGADAKGNLYILDNGGPRIQVFDAQGKFVRSFGKAGEGPGEMKMPSRIAVAADGHVALWDIALNRISIFDAQGKLVRDQAPPATVRDIAWMPSGALVCTLHSPGGETVEAFDASGKSLWANRPAGAAAAAGGRMMIFEMGGETIGSRLEATANGDVLAAGRDAYAVRRLHAGQVTQTWTRPYERQARPPMPQREDGEEGGRMVVVRRTEGGGGAATAQTTVTTSGDKSETHTFSQEDLEKMMPKHSADIRGILTFPDGRVWVVTSTNDGDTMLADEWVDGAYRKRFGIPSQWRRLRVGADGKLYGVTHDADEYPIVHRIKVTPAS